MSIHMICIPAKAARVQAVGILSRVERRYVCLRGHIFGLDDFQVAALIQAGVSFEWVSKAPSKFQNRWKGD